MKYLGLVVGISVVWGILMQVLEATALETIIGSVGAGTVVVSIDKYFRDLEK